MSKQPSPLPNWFVSEWGRALIQIGPVGLFVSPERHRIRRQRRECWNYVAVLSGAMTVYHEAGESRIPAGTCPILPQLCAYQVEYDAATKFSVDFAILPFPGRTNPLTRLRLPRVLPTGPMAEFRKLVDATRLYYDGFKPLTPAGRVLVRPIIDRILLEYLCRGFATDGFHQSAEGRLAPWLAVLDRRLGKLCRKPGLGLKDLAQASGYSMSYLSHAFKEQFGESPMAYIRRMRLEMACHLLL